MQQTHQEACRSGTAKARPDRDSNTVEWPARPRRGRPKYGVSLEPAVRNVERIRQEANDAAKLRDKVGNRIVSVRGTFNHVARELRTSGNKVPKDLRLACPRLVDVFRAAVTPSSLNALKSQAYELETRIMAMRPRSPAGGKGGKNSGSKDRGRTRNGGHLLRHHPHCEPLARLLNCGVFGVFKEVCRNHPNVRDAQPGRSWSLNTLQSRFERTSTLWVRPDFLLLFQHADCEPRQYPGALANAFNGNRAKIRGRRIAWDCSERKRVRGVS